MQKPIAEIFTWPSENPQLIGTKCDDCGAVTFPAQTRCARCSSPKMSELLLPTTGTIVTWTVQGFPPKPGFQGDATGKNFQAFEFLSLLHTKFQFTLFQFAFAILGDVDG